MSGRTRPRRRGESCVPDGRIALAARRRAFRGRDTLDRDPLGVVFCYCHYVCGGVVPPPGAGELGGPCRDCCVQENSLPWSRCPCRLCLRLGHGGQRRGLATRQVARGARLRPPDDALAHTGGAAGGREREVASAERACARRQSTVRAFAELATRAGLRLLRKRHQGLERLVRCLTTLSLPSFWRNRRHSSSRANLPLPKSRVARRRGLARSRCCPCSILTRHLRRVQGSRLWRACRHQCRVIVILPQGPARFILPS